MAAYINEEYYDMLMAHGECHGQYYVAARKYAELYPNRVRHPALYSRQRKYCSKPEASWQRKKTPIDSVTQKTYEIWKQFLVLLSKNRKLVLGTLLDNTNYRILSYNESWRKKKLHAYHYSVQRAKPTRRRLSSEEEVLQGFPQKSWWRSRISILYQQLIIQWLIVVYTKRNSKLAQYARMGRRKSASDAAQKFPSSLKIKRLGWEKY